MTLEAMLHALTPLEERSVRKTIQTEVQVPVLGLHPRLPVQADYELSRRGRELEVEILDVRLSVGHLEWEPVEPTDLMEYELTEQIITDYWADYADYQRDAKRDAAVSGL